MKKLLTTVAITSLAAFSLAACSDPEAASQSEAVADSAAFDVNSIEAVPEIAKLVPQEIKDKGTLLNALSADFAPAEFLGDDGQTPVGYDVDIIVALAKVMGLDAKSEHNDFATILPKLGSQYDLAASSFTITPERLEQVNMVSYVNVGSAYAVPKGNPNNFDPANPCGKTVGVLNGSYQQEFIAAASEECVKNGKPEIKVMPHDTQTEIAPKVISAQYDATLADSPVIAYTIKQSNNQLEQVGDILEAEAQGIAIAKENAKLAEATQKAMQYLMDKGLLNKILDNYGAGTSALTKAELNPGM